MGELRIVFRALPGPADECVLVEVEDANGRSVNCGEWRSRPDGLVELVIKELPDTNQVAEEQAGKALDATPVRVVLFKDSYQPFVDLLQGQGD